MANEFYTPGGYPSTNSFGSSQGMRAELAQVAAGFDKLPALTGHGLELLRINAAGTALESFVDPYLTTAAAAASYLTIASAAAGYLGLHATADAATKLATPRAINGVNFDGSAAITVADATKLPLGGGALTGALTGTSASFPGGVTANVTGNVTGTASGNLLLTGGTLSGPLTLDNAAASANLLTVKNTGTTAYFSVDSNTGSSFGEANCAVLWNTVGGVRIATANVARMFIDTSGKVGIGVTPSALLHAKTAGTAEIRAETGGSFAAGGAAVIRFADSVAGLAAYVGFGGNANQLEIMNTLAGSVAINTNGTPRLTVGAAGYVGINKVGGVQLDVGLADATVWAPNSSVITAQVANSTAAANSTALFGAAITNSDGTYGAVKFGALAISSYSADFVIAPRNGGTFVEALRVKYNGVIQDGEGLELGFKGLPAASVTTGAFAAADRGKCVYATAGVTIPNATMSAGDIVVIQNTTAGALTITKTITNAFSGTTGAALGATFSLPAYGRIAIVFGSGTTCYVQ